MEFTAKEYRKLGAYLAALTYLMGNNKEDSLTYEVANLAAKCLNKANDMESST